MKLFNLFTKNKNKHKQVSENLDPINIDDLRNVHTVSFDTIKANYSGDLYVDNFENPNSLDYENLGIIGVNLWSTGTDFPSIATFEPTLSNEVLCKQIINLIETAEFEYGKDSILDTFLRKQLIENNLQIKECVDNVFVKNFDKPKILIGILRTVSHFDKSVINPIGITMALGELKHENIEVKECAIRAFESWGGDDSLRILENIDEDAGWLRTYIDNVIQDIKAEICQS